MPTCWKCSGYSEGGKCPACQRQDRYLDEVNSQRIESLREQRILQEQQEQQQQEQEWEEDERAEKVAAAQKEAAQIGADAIIVRTDTKHGAYEYPKTNAIVIKYK